MISKEEKWWETAQQNKILNYYPKLYEKIKKEFEIKKPILDIGGGKGTFLKYLEIKKATIIDLVGETQLLEKGYQFVKIDITKELPTNKKYKTIFIMETLEHIKNPLYLLAQVRNLLDKEGILYISIPYTKINYKRINKNDDNVLNIHVNRWTDKEIKNQLEKLGYEVKFLKKQRRLKNLAFWWPHCFLIIKAIKRDEN